MSSAGRNIKEPKIIVVGAGVGGIAAAAHLANRGLDVTVLEKNPRPGGRCYRISRAGHHFDVGPTLYVMPRVYEQAFADLGERIEDWLDLQRVDPTYHLIFGDGQKLSLTSDLEAMRTQLESIEKGSFLRYLDYMDEGKRHYKLAMNRLVQRDFRKWTDFFNLGNLPLLFQLKALVKHYEGMGAYFDNPRLKAAFTFQDMYMGLSPFEAPATFSMLQYTELADGVWYPRGGMYRVVERLMRIAENSGARFIFDSPVERIMIERHQADAVILESGQRLEADAVLANADLPYVYRSLLPDGGESERLDRRRYSCSTISFFWGVDRRYEQLGPHTLFLSDDYAGNFKSIIRHKSLPADPSLYIHAPVSLDPSLAPSRQDSLTAIVPVGHMDNGTGQNWSERISEARLAVFERLRSIGINDLEEHLKFEICYAPPVWRNQFNLLRGSTHGLSHNLTQLGYLRPGNRHKRYRNVYFVGASTHPGTGVPTVLTSARLVAERILDDLRVPALSRIASSAAPGHAN